MSRQHINVGTNANDGTGDTLRTTGQKINSNFVELYRVLGGDSDLLSSTVLLGPNQITFEGLSFNNFETVLTTVEPTQDNLITFPDSTGEVVLTTADQDLYNKHLYNVKIDGNLRLHGVSGTGYYLIKYKGVVDSDSDLNVNIPNLLDSDTLVFQKHTQTLTNKTLTSPTINNPRIGTTVLDIAGNTILALPTTASAVNHIEISAATTGNKPTINTLGTDTNIDLMISAKGTGVIELDDPLRLARSNYSTNSTISLQDNIALFSGTSGTNTFKLPRGTGRNNVPMLFVNAGGSVATVSVDSNGAGTTWFGHTGYKNFTLRAKASIMGIYSTETSGGATEGWYLIGLDSARGLGNRVILS